MSKSQEKSILQFIAEAGLLKKVRRSGWWVAGIKDCESVAEHSFRCAVIGYCLAKMEGCDGYTVLLMTLFGDMQEARTNDLHKMAQRYLPTDKADLKAFNDQIKKLPLSIKKELSKTRHSYNKQKNKESLVARDADILECLIQAKEYYEQGYTQAKELMKKAPSHLKTKSAKKLWSLTKTTPISNWWQLLSDFKR